MKHCALLAVAVLVLSSNGALACSEPYAPSCATRSGSFDDEDEFERCKRDMEGYRDEVESYVSCVQDEAQSQIGDATSEFSDAVQSFNRRARN
jgi:hypothetical protein